MTVANVKSWSDYPLITGGVAANSTLLALLGGSLYQVTPAQFLSASLPQMGNYFSVLPGNGEFPLISYSEYSFTVNTLNNLKTTSGTITASIRINGSPVTGLSNISVTSTAQNLTATGSNIIALGSRMTLLLASNSNAANLEFTMGGILT